MMYDFEKVLEVTFKSPDAASIFLFGGIWFLAFFVIAGLFRVGIALISDMVLKKFSLGKYSMKKDP